MKQNNNANTFYQAQNTPVSVKEHNDLKERVVRLEEKTKTIFEEINELKDSLDDNTKSVNDLTTALKQEQLRVQLLNEKETNETNVKQSIQTGAIVGLIVLVATEVVRFVSGLM